MSLLRNDLFSLEKLAQENLQERLKSNLDYRESEIHDVYEKCQRLFPAGFEISKEATETYRLLTKFSRFDLRPRNITSHRKYIGSVIVAGKKVVYRMLSLLLRDALAGQEVFNRNIVKAMARLEAGGVRHEESARDN